MNGIGRMRLRVSRFQLIRRRLTQDRHSYSISPVNLTRLIAHAIMEQATSVVALMDRSPNNFGALTKRGCSVITYAAA